MYSLLDYVDLHSLPTYHVAIYSAILDMPKNLQLMHQQFSQPTFFFQCTVYRESFTEEKVHGFRGFVVIRGTFYTNCFECGGTSIKFTSSSNLFCVTFLDTLTAKLFFSETFMVYGIFCQSFAY